jgi:DNA-binding LytR/AlgR family response regulator
MNCIIIDDESTARAIIHQLCSRFDDLNVLEEFSNAVQAIKFLNQNKVDLIFLDIHMPEFTGFDLIQTLQDPPQVILTTSDRNFGIEAFEYDCIIDYIVKPIEAVRFSKAVNKAVKRVSQQQAPATINYHSADDKNELFVNIDRKLIKVDIPSIYMVKAKGDYIHIKTETQNYIVHSTLKKIAEKLPDHLFIKVHRSYIINLKKIIDIQDNTVLIKKEVVPVSRSNRTKLMKRLNLL